MGNIISGNGISPGPSKIAAIVNLPAPKNSKEGRSFLGMVNQLSKFTNHLADKTMPLRDLLSKKNSWTWSHVHDNVFQNIKECLTTPAVLAFYDVNRKAKVCNDASNMALEDSFFKNRTMDCGNQLHIFHEHSQRQSYAIRL